MRLSDAETGASEVSEDHLIPLINIVFLLLIFFMVAGTFMNPDPLGVEPPASDSEHPATLELATLSVAADGRLALDGEAFDPDELRTRVAALLEQGEGLTIRADANLPASRLLPLLRELEAAGLERSTVVTVQGEP